MARGKHSPERVIGEYCEQPVVLDIHDLIGELSKTRPLFHSEADFQLALFRHINAIVPHSQALLEEPFRLGGRPRRVDIWVPGEGVAIELKYFTRQMTICHDGEQFALKEHAAADLARRGFLADVERLEQLVQDQEQIVRTGFAVLLTNSSNLWNSSSEENNDAAFHLRDGRTDLRGKLQWRRDGLPISEGAIDLKGSYAIRWKPYSDLQCHGGQFRYLAIKVARPPLI